MRVNPFLIFRLLLGVVLVGKIAGWFLHFNEVTNDVLNAAMFILIGIWFVSAAYAWESKLSKIVFLICGLYLIVMNFVPDFYAKSIIGIPCIVIPLLMMRFSKDEDVPEDEEDSASSAE